MNEDLLFPPIAGHIKVTAAIIYKDTGVDFPETDEDEPWVYDPAADPILAYLEFEDAEEN